MDLNRIEALIEVVKDAAVSELAVRQDGSMVVVKKPARASLPAAPKIQQVKAKPVRGSHVEPESPETVIHAPMVGIIHLIDGIAEGSTIRRGQVVCAIESMKLMNEVRSDADGVAVEVYVEDGMPVEYGHALFRLNKAQEVR